MRRRQPVGRAGKLTVCTYYAAKGLTFDATLRRRALRSGGAQPDVRGARARCAQVVALDRFRPPRRAAGARAGRRAGAPLPADARLRAARYDDPPEESYEPSLRDLTGWAPRGRAPELHEAVQTTTTESSEEELPTEVRTTAADGLVDEISKLYVLAALCAEEHRRTGRCARLRSLNNPVRATANERKRKLREEETSTTASSTAARAPTSCCRRGCARSCARRCCTSRTRRAGGSRSRRPSSRAASTTTWLSDCCRRSSVDGALFAKVRARVAAHVGEGGRFDALVRWREGETLAVCRCDLLADRAAYTFVYEDRLTSTLRACTPMVLDGAAIDRCVLVNVRTGEVTTSVVLDRAPFLARMQLVVAKKEDAARHD